MKNKYRVRLLTGLVAATLALGTIAGCGSKSETNAAGGYYNSVATQTNGAAMKDSYYDEGFVSDSYYESAESESYDGGADYGNGAAVNVKENAKKNHSRKLIRTVNMEVETQGYDELMKSIENRVAELDGYIQNLDSYNGSTYGSKSSQYADLVVRIPANRLDEFVGGVAEQSNVIKKSISVEDVTLSYVDMESRKKSLQVEQERLLTLLERAEILEDIITLENRLTNVRYQIESMESQLRTYDDLVDYSTVYLKVREVIVYTPVKERTAWEKMTEGFMESLEDVKDGFVDFGIWFVVSIPHLIIWAIVITIAVFVLKALKKKFFGSRKSKKNKDHAAETEKTKEQTEEVK